MEHNTQKSVENGLKEEVIRLQARVKELESDIAGMKMLINGYEEQREKAEAELADIQADRIRLMARLKELEAELSKQDSIYTAFRNSLTDDRDHWKREAERLEKSFQDVPGFALRKAVEGDTLSRRMNKTSL